MKEVRVPFMGTVSNGDKGEHVVRIQEWLNVWNRANDFGLRPLDLDGHYGPATIRAVKNFQLHVGFSANGVVDEPLWSSLVHPMDIAFDTSDLPFSNPTQILISIMMRFAKVHPVELPGNKGPWVRAFMRGHDGDWAAWCAGAVSTAFGLMCDHFDMDMHHYFKWTWSTVKMKQYAKNSEMCDYFGSDDLKLSDCQAGDIFLIENKNNVPRHVGVIVSVGDNDVTTVEGNTNDEGSREGWELVVRKRKVDGNLALIRI